MSGPNFFHCAHTLIVKGTTRAVLRIAVRSSHIGFPVLYPRRLAENVGLPCFVTVLRNRQWLANGRM